MTDDLSQPRLVHSLDELRTLLGASRRAGRPIGFVPTMGALHAGHLSLVRTARAECGFAVVSIYVNPSQFGPHEDFQKYPRTLDADMALLADAKADVVFAPADADMYPAGYATWVDVGEVAAPLEGVCRPGHFRGVATIVLKLFNMVQPDVAYFGQKDYQQTLVIRRMVTDLNMPLTVRVCPTVREPDGLAMSSRNAYLSPEHRRQALVLSQGLRHAAQLVAQGERDGGRIRGAIEEILRGAADAEIEYVALADPETLQPIETIRGPALAALAVRIGATRLIDNEILGRAGVPA